MLRLYCADPNHGEEGSDLFRINEFTASNVAQTLFVAKALFYVS